MAVTTQQISRWQRNAFLTIGIVFAPYIFAWFTLRRGYPLYMRIVSFVWAAFLCFVLLTDKPQPKVGVDMQSVTEAQPTAAGGTPSEPQKIVPATPRSGTTAAPAAQMQSPGPQQEYLDRLDQEKTRITGGSALKPEDIASENGILSESDFLSFLAEPYFKGLGIPLDRVQTERRDAYAAWLGKLQSVRFPQLRRAFGRQIDDRLWKSDLDAQVVGGNADELLVTGAYLAANAQKADLLEQLMPALRRYRFKRISMRWYKGGEQTYWKLDTPADTAVRVLDGDEWGDPAA